MALHVAMSLFFLTCLAPAGTWVWTPWVLRCWRHRTLASNDLGKVVSCLQTLLLSSVNWRWHTLIVVCQLTDRIIISGNLLCRVLTNFTCETGILKALERNILPFISRSFLPFLLPRPQTKLSHCFFFLFYINLFIYLFIFGCVGSSLLRTDFL